MELTNNTKNQHFVSQAEQRLNAFNPQAAPENQRIFSFSVVDKESLVVALEGERGRSIESNLLLDDLFSFDVKNRCAARMNFESLFSQYESGIRENTESLIGKLASLPIPDIKSEVLNIFVAKLMNFLRNPFSVKKVLRTFGEICKYQPTDSDLLRKYKAVIAGKRPHQEYLYSQLELSNTEYTAWLLALFMLFDRPGTGAPNMLERIVKSLYEETSYEVSVHVYHYTGEHSDKRCLLSDRGYSNPLPQGPHLAFGFNLCSHAFMRYIFANIDEAVPKSTPVQIVEDYKRGPKTVKVSLLKNDLQALSIYNRQVLQQCHSRVYSSSRAIYGL